MAEMEKRNTIQTQLNEKVSETRYDVLHPETHADVVITTDNKQFVSQTEKDLWNAIESSGIRYAGEWDRLTIYTVNSLVSHNGKYYLCLDQHVGREPDETRDTGFWKNFNLEAYIANRADNVKLTEATGNSAKKIILEGNKDVAGSDYSGLQADTNLTYVPGSDLLKVGTAEGTVTIDGSTSTVTAQTFVGNLQGNATNADHAEEADRATEAEKYVKYNRNEDGTLVNGVRTEDGSDYIDDAISGLQQAVKKITNGEEGGGAILSNKLTVKKDGVQVAQFDGSQAVEVDIKQSYNPEEISDLLDTNKKIKEKWLPDSVLGQLSYKGTWNPALKGNVTPVSGDYYIAKGTGRFLPDGTSLPTSEDDFQTGDWAVYNGTSWDKIDNSDAVRMVNGQIGDVETYKLAWTPNTTYHRGDIVKYNNMIYICNSDHTAATSFESDASRWDLFGRTYTGSDAIKVEDGVIKHDVKVESGSNTNVTLASGQAFVVPSVTTDAFGHITKLDTKTIVLGNDFVDTTREIKLNGTTILTGSGDNKNKALDFAGSTWIDVKYENNKLQFEHKASDNKLGVNNYTSEKLTNDSQAEELFAGQGYSIPSFTTDAAGHVVFGEMKKFKIASSMIKHNHFDIVTDASGAQTIQAYNAEKANDAWVSTTSNSGKFYYGAINPKSTTVLNVNAAFKASKLYQGSNSVLDSGMGLYSGVDHDGQEIVGSYNATANRMEMANVTTAGVYSAVEVNAKGVVVAGGQIVEFGTVKNADPSDALAVGGLFFRKLS